MDVIQVATVCHEANRAYCASIGDNSQKLWDEAPIWQKESAINGVEFHLKNLKAGNEILPSSSHESWLEEKRLAGWKWGPVKDEAAKEHPCFIPFERLPGDQKIKDYLFCSIVGAFWQAEREADLAIKQAVA